MVLYVLSKFAVPTSHETHSEYTHRELQQTSKKCTEVYLKIKRVHFIVFPFKSKSTGDSVVRLKT